MEWRGRTERVRPPSLLSARRAQEVHVTFTPEGGGTRVCPVHSGWERYGEGAAEMRGNYEQGWTPVLARFSGTFGEAAAV